MESRRPMQALRILLSENRYRSLTNPHRVIHQLEARVVTDAIEEIRYVILGD